jgi:hypothetical protein
MAIIAINTWISVQLPGRRQFRHPPGLRPGERKIEPGGDAALEHVEVFRQRGRYRLACKRVAQRLSGAVQALAPVKLQRIPRLRRRGHEAPFISIAGSVVAIDGNTHSSTIANSIRPTNGSTP